MKYIVFIFFGAILLSIIGMIFFLVWVFKKSTKPKSQEFMESEQGKMYEKVQQMKNELVDWGMNDATSITSNMNYKSKKGFSNHLTGRIMDENLKPLVAFDRVERGLKANGYMFASTTAFDIFYDIRVDEYTITYNNKILGDIDKQGNIYDASNKKIGHALHPVKIGVNIGPIRKRAGESSFPMKMNGRLLATIQVAPNHTDKHQAQSATFNNENSYGERVLLLHDVPTEEEKKWLNAMAILETAFHGHWLI